MSREWVQKLSEDERNKLVRSYGATIEGMDRTLTKAFYSGLLDAQLEIINKAVVVRRRVAENPSRYLAERNYLARLAEIPEAKPEDYKDGKLSKPKRRKRDTSIPEFRSRYFGLKAEALF